MRDRLSIAGLGTSLAGIGMELLPHPYHNAIIGGALLIIGVGMMLFHFVPLMVNRGATFTARYPMMSFLLFIAAGAIVGGLAWVLIRAPVKPQVSADTASEQATDQNIDNLIQYLPSTAELHPHFTATSPYIDLVFGFRNDSSFDLTFDYAEGNVNYNGEPFEAKLISKFGVVSSTSEASNGVMHQAIGYVILRQWLSTENVKTLLRDLKQGKDVILDTRPVGICFSYDRQKTVCKGIPDLPFRLKR